MSSRDYKLVKKWRLDEWRHSGTRSIVGIYVSTDGEFYARIPETDVGELVIARTKDDLIKAVRLVADRVFNLVWQPVIRVKLPAPARRHGNRHGFSSQEIKWDPNDPATAGDEIRLDFHRVEAAEREGKRFVREWPLLSAPPGYNENRRIEADDWYRPEPGIHVQLPYTEEMWAALQDFQSRIRDLNHNLRTLISHEDVGSLLLLASRQGLLIGPTEEA